MTAATTPGPVTCLDETGLKITEALYKAVATLTSDPCLLAMIGSWGDTLDDADILDGLRRWIEMGECFIPEVAAPSGLATKPDGGIAQQEPQIPWHERWYGSEPYRGWSILQGRELIAHIGGDESMSRAISDIVMKHNGDDKSDGGVESRHAVGATTGHGVAGCQMESSLNERQEHLDKRHGGTVPAGVAPGPSGPTGGETMKLGRFNHHPDPAIDFCIEVEVIEAEWLNIRQGFTNGTPPRSEIVERLAKAMQFRVGGDQQSVAAKDILRRIEKEVSAPAPVDEPMAFAWAVTRDSDPTFPCFYRNESDADAMVSGVNVNPPARKLPLYAAPPSVSVEEVARAIEILKTCRTSYCGYAITKSEQYPGVVADFYKEIQRLDKSGREALALLQQSEPRS